nr:hypothetical protein [Tanacetum cinerariifolium]
EVVYPELEVGGAASRRHGGASKPTTPEYGNQQAAKLFHGVGNPLHPERKLAQGQVALAFYVALAQALQVAGQQVVGAVDDAQVLAAPALEGGLNERAAGFGDEVVGLHHHALTPAGGEGGPPLNGGFYLRQVGQLHHAVGRGAQQAGVGEAEGAQGFHVPGVVAVE